MLEETAAGFLKDHGLWGREAVCLVAVSGGVDSVALLWALAQLRQAAGLTISTTACGRRRTEMRRLFAVCAEGLLSPVLWAARELNSGDAAARWRWPPGISGAPFCWPPETPAGPRLFLLLITATISWRLCCCAWPEEPH